LSRSTTAEDKNKQRWKANAAKALERAERIKKFIETPTRAGSGAQTTSTQDPESPMRLTPIGIDHFSPRKYKRQGL